MTGWLLVWLVGPASVLLAIMAFKRLVELIAHDIEDHEVW